MSEKYVKDIIDKLDEIEKLHSKLRNLVPRMKNDGSENITKNIRNGEFPELKMKEDEKEPHKQIPVGNHRTSETFKNLRDSSKTNMKKLFTVGRDSEVLPTRYFNRGKWRRLRKNSVGFVTKQWHNKGDKIKDFLSNIIERDIILVNRAAQTAENEIIGTSGTSTEEKEKIESLKTNQAPQKRRRTMQDQLERLLEHFNYSRESEAANENRVTTHRHSISEDEPRRERKTLLPSNENTETLKIISSAEKISTNNNKKVK